MLQYVLQGDEQKFCSQLWLSDNNVGNDGAIVLKSRRNQLVRQSRGKDIILNILSKVQNDERDRCLFAAELLVPGRRSTSPKVKESVLREGREGRREHTQIAVGLQL